jgi:CRISPR-associated endonuclease/helicase Cas3
VGSKGASGESQTATETAQFRRTRTIPLREHAAGVQQVVEKFAHVLDLPPKLRDSLSAAARFHDLGKWDPRFQAWLRGVGLFIPQRSDEILAKSGAISPRNLPAIRRARSLAGYPGDARHEALSAALAEVALSDSGEGFDMDLVLHLIASHHGYARPWFSVPASSEPILLEAEMDGLHLTREFDYQKLQAGPAVVDRFWRLVRRYGWWGLAFVEAVLRLADHRRSEQEEVNA